MGRNRSELFRNNIIKYGGNVIDEKSPIQNLFGSCLLIFDENTFKTWEGLQICISKNKHIQNMEKNACSSDLKYIASKWLSECLGAKSLIEMTKYQIFPEKRTIEKRSSSIENNITEQKKIRNLEPENYLNKKMPANIEFDSSEGSYSEDESNINLSNLEYFELQLNSKSKQIQNSKSWTCAHSSKEQKENYNKHITEKLEQISSIYENTNDKYKALVYQKAILILKRHPHTIQSREEALALPGIGKRIADKIWEIIQTGDLRKLEEMNSKESISSIKIFTDIHGVGPTTAQLFVSQGFRTLDDLRTKANLTRQQKIGLKYYEEFKQRIPRDEVAEIERVVKDAALSLDSGLIVQACGSYRRGKETCGDVDILITHPDRKSHKNIFTRLINLLHEKNFLTDDLVLQDENSDTQRKYLGVCCLNEEKNLHRRIDIIVVPYDEYACALIYFTGSAHFIRSMRHLARKLGLSLSEKSLNKNVKRKGPEKINVGEKIVTNTEEEVFKLLNLSYRKPEERDF